MRFDKPIMGSMVIHHRHPFADDGLQLVEVEEGLRFGIQAARVNIRALIAWQRLQQALS
jgi:hypothetical protein